VENFLFTGVAKHPLAAEITDHVASKFSVVLKQITIPVLFLVTHICSPSGISLQAKTRFPYHFYQPARLKTKL